MRIRTIQQRYPRKGFVASDDERDTHAQIIPAAGRRRFLLIVGAPFDQAASIEFTRAQLRAFLAYATRMVG